MEKIVFIIDSFPNYSETFLYNQIYFLIDQGFNVRILALKQNKVLSDSIHQKMSEYNLSKRCIFLTSKIGFEIITNLFFYPHISIRILKFFGIKKGFFIIRNLKIFNIYNSFDVIHAHYGHIGAMICDLKSIGLFESAKVVCSFHGEDLSHKILNVYKEKYKNIGIYADRVTVNSKYTQECLIKSVGELWSNVEIVPVPVDTKFFKPKLSQKNENKIFKIVFCGRLIKWKAPTKAIQIVHELRKLNYSIELHIIGDGPEFQACKELILINELNRVVTLHGLQSQEEILEAFDNSDCFLFPAIRESDTLKTEAQGLVIQEAQAMGLPVIISNVGGMKYGIVEGGTGFIAAEKDVTGFVEKIIMLINNPALREEMKIAAREYIVKNFDVSVIGSRMLDIYGFNKS